MGVYAGHLANNQDIDKDLIVLTSFLAKLTRPRYRSVGRLKTAHTYLRTYARVHNLSEEWCDAVLLLFLNDGDSLTTD